jgi:hypothetical protein
MKIITADKFKDFNEWVDPETLRDLRGYESKSKDNFEVYEAEANEVIAKTNKHNNTSFVIINYSC